MRKIEEIIDIVLFFVDLIFNIPVFSSKELASFMVGIGFLIFSFDFVNQFGKDMAKDLKMKGIEIFFYPIILIIFFIFISFPDHPIPLITIFILCCFRSIHGFGVSKAFLKMKSQRQSSMLLLSVLNIFDNFMIRFIWNIITIIFALSYYHKTYYEEKFLYKVYSRNMYYSFVLCIIGTQLYVPHSSFLNLIYKFSYMVGMIAGLFIFEKTRTSWVLFNFIFVFFIMCIIIMFLTLLTFFLGGF